MREEGATRKKTILCWSSGKDSAWALHVLRGRDDVEVVGLMTTIDATQGIIPMHGVRLELLEQQANAVGLPLRTVPISAGGSNEEYDAAMTRFVEDVRSMGVEWIAFGDLFLEDIRAYRESRLAGSGLEPIFPLWGIPTDELAQQMIAGGLRARITCVDTSQIDARFTGREYDASFIADLPASADPCGERGEFHSFVYDGPGFLYPVEIGEGKMVEGERFWRYEI
jgi:uncharacterized protein (TIGR00290 family)